MSAKKTVHIRTLIDEVNRLNRESVCGKETRNGWNRLLEHVLVENDVYCGFRYLKLNEVPPGQQPGMVHNYIPNEEGKHEYSFFDESRKFYYIPT